jgi:uncharacterized membrane protein
MAGADWVAEWALRRSGAFRLVQLRVLGLLCMFALVLMAVPWRPAGLAAILPVLALGLAAWVATAVLSARHATDRDLIAMNPSLVRVERHRAGQVSRVDFHPRWVRVEPDCQDGSLIRLSGQGRSVVVGEFVPRESRPHLAEEFRWALRHLDD